MKKKILFIIGGALILAIFFLWWFFKKENNPPLASQGEIPCIAFQGENPLLPCFKEMVTDLGTDPLPSYAVTIEKNEKNEAVYDCFSKNQVESNDCVIQIAYEKKDTSLCSFVTGAYSEAYCKEKISNPKNETINTSIVDKTIPSLSFSRPEKETITKVSSPVPNIFSRTGQNFSSQNDGRFSLQGFYERLKGSPLKLFAFSETQVRPGAELIASGFGFTSTENTVSIGGYEVSGLSSSDGMTLSFVVPSSISDGVYDAWVTNSKGTSRNDSQPIRLTITQNPVPRPVITSVSPSLPSYLDTITLSGEHLSGAFGLYTSLGIIENLSVSDSSIQFKFSDSSFMSKIKDLDQVKGKVVQVLVIVATPQGYNKDAFVFNVQF